MSYWLRLACVVCCFAFVTPGCGGEGGDADDSALGVTHEPHQPGPPTDSMPPPNPGKEERLPDRFRK